MDLKYDRQYDDIIDLPHHVSKKHPQMSLYARSAQFAPFAALTGYEDAVRETGRQTADRIEIEEEYKAILDSKLQIILEQISKTPEITITYFIKDQRKNGGSYSTKTGLVKKIDNDKQEICFVDNSKILINDIIDITGEIFKMFENT